MSKPVLSRRAITTLGIACAVVVGAVFLYLLSREKVIMISDAQLFYPEIMHADILQAEKVQKEIFEREIIAGIGPHHLPLSAGMLKGLYSAIADEGFGVDTVVILAPDHNNFHPESIVISDATYATSWGRIQSNKELVKALLGTGLVVQDIKPFEQEHAVYSHLPFMQEYIPQARLVALLFGQQASNRQAIELGDWLAVNAGEDVLIIASLDLSHYQPYMLAQAQDEDTIQILRALDSTRVGEAFLDSPQVVHALFQYLGTKRADQSRLVWQANSADLGGDPEVTTGYVTLLYGR